MVILSLVKPMMCSYTGQRNVNVKFLICPCAESQQQKRRGIALGASTYHCLRANSEGRNAGRGEKQKGTETSLTHSFTK